MSERNQAQSVNQAVQELTAKVETWEAKLEAKRKADVHPAAARLAALAETAEQQAAQEPRGPAERPAAPAPKPRGPPPCWSIQLIVPIVRGRSPLLIIRAPIVAEGVSGPPERLFDMGGRDVFRGPAPRPPTPDHYYDALRTKMEM